MYHTIIDRSIRYTSGPHVFKSRSGQCMSALLKQQLFITMEPTELTVQHLEDLRQAWPHPATLSLCAAYNDNAALVHELEELLTEWSDKLVDISIINWSEAADDLLFFLRSDKFKNITRLDVSGCTKFTGESFRRVHWHELQYLDITDCLVLHRNFIRIILRDCPKLTDLRVAFTTWRDIGSSLFEESGFNKDSIVKNKVMLARTL